MEETIAHLVHYLAADPNVVLYFNGTLQVPYSQLIGQYGERHIIDTALSSIHPCVRGLEGVEITTRL